jgi:hypothetical protein
MVLPLLQGPRKAASWLMVAVGVQFAYVGHVGGDWMPFHRFFLPIVPLGAVLVAWGLQVGWDSVRTQVNEVRGLTVGFAVLSLGWVAVKVDAESVDSVSEQGKLGEAAHVMNHTNKNLLTTAPLMRYVVRQPGDRLVTDYAGVFSVFTEAAVIDQWGLCQKDIALKGGTNGINPIYGKECAQCYPALDPDYFHVVVPIVRGPQSYSSQSQIIGDVFQGRAIDHYLNIRQRFAAGRVMEVKSQRTLWFLEKRRPDRPLVRREPAPGIQVDYPFEPAGS